MFLGQTKFKCVDVYVSFGVNERWLGVFYPVVGLMCFDVDYCRKVFFKEILSTSAKSAIGHNNILNVAIEQNFDQNIDNAAQRLSVSPPQTLKL